MMLMMLKKKCYFYDKGFFLLCMHGYMRHDIILCDTQMLGIFFFFETLEKAE